MNMRANITAGSPMKPRSSFVFAAVAWLAFTAGILAGVPLVIVTISPEARVKAQSGAAAPELRQGEWVEFPVTISNAAGITAPLRIDCAQAMRDSTDTARDRWLQLELRPAGPLTGRPAETRTLRLRARDAGKRTAILNFNAGQGTQDLGFRSDVLVTFTVKPKP